MDHHDAYLPFDPDYTADVTETDILSEWLDFSTCTSPRILPAVLHGELEEEDSAQKFPDASTSDALYSDFLLPYSDVDDEHPPFPPLPDRFRHSASPPMAVLAHGIDTSTSLTTSLSFSPAIAPATVFETWPPSTSIATGPHSQEPASCLPSPHDSPRAHASIVQPQRPVSPTYTSALSSPPDESIFIASPVPRLAEGVEIASTADDDEFPSFPRRSKRLREPDPDWTPFVDRPAKKARKPARSRTANPSRKAGRTKIHDSVRVSDPASVPTQPIASGSKAILQTTPGANEPRRQMRPGTEHQPYAEPDSEPEDSSSRPGPSRQATRRPEDGKENYAPVPRKRKSAPQKRNVLCPFGCSKDRFSREADLERHLIYAPNHLDVKIFCTYVSHAPAKVARQDTLRRHMSQTKREKAHKQEVPNPEKKGRLSNRSCIGPEAWKQFTKSQQQEVLQTYGRAVMHCPRRRKAWYAEHLQYCPKYNSPYKLERYLSVEKGLGIVYRCGDCCKPRVKPTGDQSWIWGEEEETLVRERL